MSLFTILLKLLLIFQLKTFPISKAERPGSDIIKPCCVPSFFRSVMDVTGGFINNMGNGVPVDQLTHLYYDYTTNKTRTDVNVTLPDGTKFLHTEIADYAKHLTYKIDGNRCQIIEFNDTIQDRCIPSHAKLVSVSKIGSVHKNMDIHTWQYIEPLNDIVVKRAVTADRCLPVYQIEHGLIDGSLSSYIYIIMDTDAQGVDLSIMEPPGFCKR